MIFKVLHIPGGYNSQISEPSTASINVKISVSVPDSQTLQPYMFHTENSQYNNGGETPIPPVSESPFFCGSFSSGTDLSHMKT